MVKLPIYVINLLRRGDRWKNMLLEFSQDSLVRVPAFDGRSFGNRIPLEIDTAIKRVKCDRVFGDLENWPLSPSEKGCAFSHILLWYRITQRRDEWSIVLEDDVQPTDVLGARSLAEVVPSVVPKDAGVVFLFGNEKKPHHTISILDSQDRCLSGCMNWGYAISKAGAECALRASLPLYLPIDVQWRIRGIESSVMVDELGRKIPLEECGKIRGYGLRDPLIKKSVRKGPSSISHTIERLKRETK